MSEGDSVTHWIGDLKAGDSEAAQRLWERYFSRLVGLLGDRLRVARRAGTVDDEEDVALSALKSVCMGAAKGRFPKLGDRDDLWGLLVVVASRKASDRVRAQRRQKRGGGKVHAESALAAAGDEANEVMAQVAGHEPTPEFAAEVAEAFELRLAGLEDATLREIALLRLEGYSNDEIADRLGCASRTVMRKVDLIRRRWAEGEPDS